MFWSWNELVGGRRADLVIMSVNVTDCHWESGIEMSVSCAVRISTRQTRTLLLVVNSNASKSGG